MVSLDPAAFLLALAITLTELTEVVALVVALYGETGTIRHGVLGALGGIALVGALALGAGALLLAVPTRLLLYASATVLAAFGVFLFRSTFRSYRRARTLAPSVTPPSSVPLGFTAGFTVGGIEALEAAIVLIGIAAGGQGFSAIAGAVVAGAILVGLAALLHERIRRVKTPQLKLFATGMLFTLATFWGGEAAGFSWPFGDLLLIPIFVVALLVVRGTVGVLLGREALPPVQTNR
jgi:uncharacterized membrane protein